MKGKQFIKRLRMHGVRIVSGRGKGGHCLAIYKGRQSTIPVHGDTDFGPAFLKMICKQLGLEPNKIMRG